ncbi:MAG TPA: D-alanine--D-alanine ligase [Polyangiaceae bacterium]|nr:D-alanine--D-alanine ligase [Polyangiaceae bacterium]
MARAPALSVAVIQGGPSSEAEVSRASARGVAQALADAGHRPVRLELDAFLSESLRTGGYDVVFPVVHGAVGEDGALQGLLEVLELPYVGSGVLASAMAMNKRVARGVFERAGLPVAKGVALERIDAAEAARRARREVGGALVVKPCSHGSAIGVARLETEATEAAVAAALEAVWAIDDVAIVEHFARGREVTCGVHEGGDGSAVALPPTEILSPNDPFYTYEARYTPGRSEHVCPARLPPAVLASVQAIAVGAHAALGCRDLSRADFVVGDLGDPETVTLLEVNTLPGMTATSLYPEAAAVAGLSMRELCAGFVARAHMRGPSRRLAARPMPVG